MSDVHSKEIRSKNMSAIKGKNTSPEMTVRKALFSQGFRYRLHVTALPGKPDIVLPKYKTVIFVHGCFWHRHEGCRYATTPENNRDFWIEKLNGNVQRDRLNYLKLRNLGWNVLLIWESELKSDDWSNALITAITQNI